MTHPDHLDQDGTIENRTVEEKIDLKDLKSPVAFFPIYLPLQCGECMQRKTKKTKLLAIVACPMP